MTNKAKSWVDSDLEYRDINAEYWDYLDTLAGERALQTCEVEGHEWSHEYGGTWCSRCDARGK
jgi:hypothetical protein